MNLLIHFLRGLPRAFTRTLLLAIVLTLQPTLQALAAEAAPPSFEASSELFELVGRIKEGRLILSLDRWASNEPVGKAQIEIESQGNKLQAEPQPDGFYTLDATPFAAPGTYPLSITITDGEESDLLVAEWVIAEPTANDATRGLPFSPRPLVVLVVLMLLAAGTVLVLRRNKGVRT